MRENTNHSKRIVINFEKIYKEFKFTIGKVTNHTVGQPLEEHCHEEYIEISYLVTGNQIYTVEGRAYPLESGDVFVTYPGETHGSGNYQKDKSRLYYIQLHEDIFEYLGVEEEGEYIKSKFQREQLRVFKGSRRISGILDAILIESESEGKLNKTKIRNYMSELLIELIEDRHKNHIADSGQRLAIEGITIYIEEYIEKPLSIKELADRLNISEGRFKTLFKEYVGIPPKEYILRRKIERAKKLIEETNESITNIAYILGFSNSQYFTTVFKRFNLYTPREYREKNKSETM